VYGDSIDESQLQQFITNQSSCLRSRTLDPDIFGYVSSLTKYKDLVQSPQAGSTLIGIDRARLLKDVKVKVLRRCGRTE
jgi:hypothetical protein